jgi:hypothetical protein
MNLATSADADAAFPENTDRSVASRFGTAPAKLSTSAAGWSRGPCRRKNLMFTVAQRLTVVLGALITSAAAVAVAVPVLPIV